MFDSSGRCAPLSRSNETKNSPNKLKQQQSKQRSRVCTDGAKMTAGSVAATAVATAVAAAAAVAAHNRNSDKLTLLFIWCQNELEKINANEP